MSDVENAKQEESYGNIQIPVIEMVTLINGTYQNVERAIREAIARLTKIQALLAAAPVTGSHTGAEVSAAIMGATDLCIKRLEQARLAMKIE